MTSPIEQTQERPRQVWIASILLVVFGGLGLLLAMMLLSIVNDTADVPGFAYGLVYGQFLLSGMQILSGIFVWLGRPWARTAATVVCGINLVGALLNLLSGAILPAITGAAVNIALLRLLRGNEVAQWCSGP